MASVAFKAGIDPANGVRRLFISGDPSVGLGIADQDVGLNSVATRLDVPSTYVKTGPNPTDWTEEVEPGALTADQLAALAGTSGTPNGSNPFVTSSDSRLSGASGLPGIVVATANGLVGDGTTDDGPALQTLANTTLSGGGTIYFTPLKTYRIATTVTIPANVVIWAPWGAVLKFDTAASIVQGPIKAGAWQWINEVNGGIVRFEPGASGGSNTTARGRLPEVYPEWWGAVPDGATDSTAALNACIESVAGYTPSGGTDPAAGARSATAMIRLSNGPYMTTSSVLVRSLRGLRIEGAGNTTSLILYKATATFSYTASSGSTSTLVVSGTPWTTNQFAPAATGANWYANCYAGTGAGQFSAITSNTNNTLTLTTTQLVAFDSTSQFYIGPHAVLDLDGVSDIQLSHFSVSASPSSYPRFGLYYHWNGSLSAASSSVFNGLSLSAIGQWVKGGMWFGGQDSDGSGVQSDNVYLNACQARPSTQWTLTNGLCETGIGFGDGTSANALNYNSVMGLVTNVRYGYNVNTTNAKIDGGDIEKCDTAVNINNTCPVVELANIRVETTHRLIQQTGGVSVDAHCHVRNVSFNLNTFQNEYYVGYDLPFVAIFQASATIEHCRFGTPTLTTHTTTSATASTITPAGGGLPTSPATHKGWLLETTGGTGAGQARYISSNTATVYTVSPNFTTTPDATTTFRVSPAPRILVGGGGRVTVRDVGMYATPAERVFYIDTGAQNVARGELDGYTVLTKDTAPAAAFGVGRMSFQNQPAYLFRDRVIAAVAEMSNSTGAPQPEAMIYGHTPGLMTIPALESTNLKVTALGQAPAPFVTVHGGTGTSHTYYLVPKVNAGDGTTYLSGLVSSGTTVSTAAAFDIDTNYVTVQLPNSAHGPASVYDILKDDTSHSIATNVPWYKFPWKDTRNDRDAYTYSGADATGVAALGAVTYTKLSGPALFNAGNLSGVVVLDYNNGGAQKGVLTGNITSLTVNNVPDGNDFLFVVAQDATGSRTIGGGEWVNANFPGGAAAVVTPTASKIDRYLRSVDGSTITWAVVSQNR